MELVYLYHSGFAILDNAYTLVVDFYEDSESPIEGILHRELLKRPGRFYVLSSHFHADHFTEEVLKWRELRSDIVYLFSSDIQTVMPMRGENIVFLKKGDSYHDDLLAIRAFGSTDVGVSFFIEVNGWKVFHAGDLNNWHWMDESDEEEWKGYESHFLCELQEIAAEVSQVDVVMFPVDPRLGKEYMRGPRQFVEAIRVKWFVPMHFGESYQLAAAFQKIAEAHGCLCFTPAFRGERVRLGNRKG